MLVKLGSLVEGVHEILFPWTLKNCNTSCSTGRAHIDFFLGGLTLVVLDNLVAVSSAL